MQDCCKAKFEVHDSASMGVSVREGSRCKARTIQGSMRIVAVLVGCMVETRECKGYKTITRQILMCCAVEVQGSAKTRLEMYGRN